VLECWSVGVLERWSVGALERWSVGALERWSVGALERWSVGVLERWSVGAVLKILGESSRLLASLLLFLDAADGQPLLCTLAIAKRGSR
jgi:hypothetical protein